MFSFSLFSNTRLWYSFHHFLSAFCWCVCILQVLPSKGLFLPLEIYFAVILLHMIAFSQFFPHPVLSELSLPLIYNVSALLNVICEKVFFLYVGLVFWRKLMLDSSEVFKGLAHHSTLFCWFCAVFSPLTSKSELVMSLPNVSVILKPIFPVW